MQSIFSDAEIFIDEDMIATIGFSFCTWRCIMDSNRYYFSDEESDDRYYEDEYRDENETRMMERINSRIMWDRSHFLNYRGQRVG